MATKFFSGIKAIHEAEKPIAKAWELSFTHLELDNKLKKLMEILADHENLLINYNPYHNHFHLAEVVWASAFLAKKENFEEKYFDSMVVLLLAATFHDADHPGRVNKYAFEVEQKSALFFRNWWKNNSLFVENIVGLTPINIEQAVTDLILFTDFSEGQPKVNLDYAQRKEVETFGLRMCKLKKILNEADLLLNFLPQTAFKKTNLILRECSRNIEEEQKWMLLLGFLQEAPITFTSDAAKDLKLDILIKKFATYLSASKSVMNNSEKLQEELEAKFKAF
jgi:hypothetical protein